MEQLKPKDHAEAIALFRSEIVGSLVRRDLDRGELRSELKRLSQKRYRPPQSKKTRSYGVPTLERWYYRYKRGGLLALRPKRRSDAGRGQNLTAEQKTLLLDIRKEHRSASVPLILRTLELEGRLSKETVSEATVRRLYREQGLDRIALRDGQSPKTRLRWQAERAGALWHADVCYGPPLIVGQQKRPLRIHALLDDASRYVVGIEAMHTERESDMLRLLVRSLRRHGAPDVLYLDNGSTYRGEILRLGCERLGITLLHAAPYDPEARGKMERFWGTLRSQCLNFLGSLSSLHDVNTRLYAFLDSHYHGAAHAGLLGKTPGAVFSDDQLDRPVDYLSEAMLREALTVKERRRVRRDTTVSVDGQDYELEHGFLAGRVVTVGYCVIDDPRKPWIELEGKVLPLHPVNPQKNATRKRPDRKDATTPSASQRSQFQPNEARLNKILGRKRQGDTDGHR
jgi:transposase InsO family protein